MIEVVGAFMAIGASAPAVTPSVTAITVATLSGGTCSGTHLSTSASVRVSFTVTNTDTSNYTIKVYKDGVYVSSTTGGSNHVDYTVGGYVTGHSGGFISSYVFDARVVRNSDGLVIPGAGKTASTWVEEYGLCSGSV